MIYIFLCSTCKKNFELEKKISEEFTEEQLICSYCGNKLHRDYNAEGKPTHIPDNMKATQLGSFHNSLNFDKSPSGRKHFYGGYSGK